jgi:hypothetical protein
LKPDSDVVLWTPVEQIQVKVVFKQGRIQNLVRLFGNLFCPLAIEFSLLVHILQIQIDIFLVQGGFIFPKMQQLAGVGTGELIEEILLKEVLVVFGRRSGFVVRAERPDGVIEEMVKVFGDGVRNETVDLVVFFLLGRRVKGRSQGLFLVGKVLLDHGEDDLLVLCL